MAQVVPHLTPEPLAAAVPVVDIVIPVYDEERVLAASVERLHAYLTRRFPFTWRITIADNASVDATGAIADALSARLPHVRVIHLAQKGRGRALRAAWADSDAIVAAYMDVDLSTDLDALLPLVAPLVSGHSDVAIGCRLSPTASVARAPKRELISRTYNLILRSLLATRIHDAQCGFKAVRGDIARRLVPAVRDDGWFFDTELLLLAERNGLRVHEVPVDWIDDPDSRVHILDTAIGDLRGAARMLRTFASGRGRIDLGPAARPPLADDFGRRTVRFGLIGVASTLVSLVLFLLLRGPLGAVAANAIAVSATFLANTWANARITQRVARPHWARSCALYAGSLLCTSAALALADAAGGGLLLELAALGLTWTLATVVRFAAMARDHRPVPAPGATGRPLEQDR